MIPREILKKTRPIERRPNRLVTETGTACFDVKRKSAFTSALTCVLSPGRGLQPAPLSANSAAHPTNPITGFYEDAGSVSPSPWEESRDAGGQNCLNLTIGRLPKLNRLNSATCNQAAEAEASFADDAATFADDRDAFGDDAANFADDRATGADNTASLADQPAGLGDDRAGFADAAATRANEAGILADDRAAAADTPAIFAGDRSNSRTLWTVSRIDGPRSRPKRFCSPPAGQIPDAAKFISQRHDPA
jgi:hypothetical protein